MVFQHVDPMLFLPQRMNLINVEHRGFMVHAMAGTRPSPRHEDWAIATIQPLLGNIITFQAVREVLDDFFTDVARVQICSIKPSYLGQALVQFARIPMRDSLVLNSPHQFGGHFHFFCSSQLGLQLEKDIVQYRGLVDAFRTPL